MGYDIFSITGAMSIGSTSKWCWKTDGDGTVYYWRFPVVKKDCFPVKPIIFGPLVFVGFFLS